VALIEGGVNRAAGVWPKSRRSIPMRYSGWTPRRIVARRHCLLAIRNVPATRMRGLFATRLHCGKAKARPNRIERVWHAAMTAPRLNAAQQR